MRDAIAHFRRFAISAAALVATAAASPAQPTPVGLWRTVSDVDGQPTAIVEIREVNGELVGVVRSILVQGEADRVCTDCPGERKGQRIVGMEILRHMHRDGDEWSGGEILDPDNGKVYRAKMHLEDGGAKLVVRGFIGISLFGRSQTWFRVDAPGSDLPSPRRLEPASPEPW